MNARTFVALIGLVGASCPLHPAFAFDTGSLPDVFTFAAGYQLETPTQRNIVELGIVNRCNKKWCIHIKQFDSDLLLPRVPTKWSHQMHAPYGGSKCFNDHVSDVRPSQVKNSEVSIDIEPDGFAIKTDRFRYHWISDPKTPNGYTLARLESVPDIHPVNQAVGFGFPSKKEIKGDISQDQLAALYKGQIYHKTAFTKSSGDWTYAQSSINFRVFKKTEDGKVLSRSIPGDKTIVAKYGGPMWVQSTVVLARTEDTISPLLHEYGHDFNRDGCFNESGHNKLLLPIGEQDVESLIYIEYTSDYQRGFPMLSVGRYYR